MTLTVESKNERIEMFYDSDVVKDAGLLDIPGTHDIIQRTVVKHSDIDSIIYTLQLYKERMTEVLGTGGLA